MNDIRSEQQEHQELFGQYQGTIDELTQLINCIEQEIRQYDDKVKDYKYWSFKLELRAKQAHLRVQERILKDRENHYHNIFLPNFEKKSAEVNANLSKIEQQAKDILLKPGRINTFLAQAMKKTLDEYPTELAKLQDEQKRQDLKNHYYSALKFQIENHKKGKK